VFLFLPTDGRSCKDEEQPTDRNAISGNDDKQKIILHKNVRKIK
jgi:hypothetical protein